MDGFFVAKLKKFAPGERKTPLDSDSHGNRPDKVFNAEDGGSDEVCDPRDAVDER